MLKQNYYFSTKLTNHMAKIAEVRLTLAAFIYGIEIDLKHLLKIYIIPFQNDLSFFRNKTLEEVVLSRYLKDNPLSDWKNNLDEVVEYLDFQDIFTILLSNEPFIPNNIINYLKINLNFLKEITPVRNRVMHTRPLLAGDFTTVYEFISSLKRTDPINWSYTIETRDLIEKDPSYVLTLKMPTIDGRDKKNKILHNLPAPDFDETGFIGRKKDVDDITKLILSNKVVSIIGDGGVGKTALALKIAYDIIDMNERCPFELVIWTSAKTTMLTSKGIQEIHNAIKDYSGIVDVIFETLDTASDGNNKQKLNEILDYLDLFKTLLIIDNLETIQSEEIRDFIREAQMRCHIVITSRIGLGELEYPRKLKGLSEVESTKLIREIARIRNSDTLLQLPQNTLVDIASKLYFNPLAMKWFVNTVESGIAPNEVLNNKNDLLNFCLSNVYEKLSNGAILVLKTIRAARRKLTPAEIIYLSELEPIKVREHLIELFRTTLITREIHAGNIEEIFYSVSDFANDFLSNNYPIEASYVKTINFKYKELTKSITELQKVQKYNEFALNAIAYESPNQRIAAKFLSEALQISQQGNFEQALLKVQEAKNMVPNYSESYRVSAFIKATKGDLLSAETDYELGIEIDPNNARLLYYYAQFLLFKLEDNQKALEYAEKVHTLRPNHPYTSLLFARCYNKLQNHSKGIQILKSLLQTTLDSKIEKVASTDLINMYNECAKSALKIESDFHIAKSYYKKSFEVYSTCKEKKILDYKLVKNFSESLYSYISNVPPTLIDDNIEYCKLLIHEHENELSLSPLKNKILYKYKETFHDNSFDNLIEHSQFDNSHIGNVIFPAKEPHSNYAFIEADGDRYYANRMDFLDVSNYLDWKNLKEGTLVSFEVGENFKGPCAKNVKVINY